MSSQFSKGDLVVCIDAGVEKSQDFGRLVVGNTYVVLSVTMLPCGIDEWDLFIDVNDERNENGYFFAHRFVPRSEWLKGHRERLLKELGV